jgi:acyl carrier protein
MLVEALVRHEVAAVLGYANDDGIPVGRGFFELGLDSLMSVELKRRLETVVGRSLPSTLTFNYPNVLSLSGFLEQLLFAAPAVDSVPSPAEPVLAPPTARDTDDLTDDELEAELLARLAKLRLQ